MRMRVDGRRETRDERQETGEAGFSCSLLLFKPLIKKQHEFHDATKGNGQKRDREEACLNLTKIEL